MSRRLRLSLGEREADAVLTALVMFERHREGEEITREERAELAAADRAATKLVAEMRRIRYADPKACDICGGPRADHGILNGYHDKHDFEKEKTR